IGRGSCRERGENLGGAVFFKKKKKEDGEDLAGAVHPLRARGPADGRATASRILRERSGGSAGERGHYAENSDFFFFQAEDGIRDWSVTGVQTCALPI